MLYLLLGQDSLSKDEQLRKIKQEFLSPHLEQFNLDTLYGKELGLKGLQEALLRLPAAGAAKRVIVLRDAQSLAAEVKDFILTYVQNPSSCVVLVIEAATANKDEFISRLLRYGKVLRFKETEEPDTFVLSRQITARRPDQALKILSQLLKNGERPERILGGLRYAWEKETLPVLAARARLKLLVRCDLEIKTGRLKPVFALEKLVVGLCALGKPPG